MQHTTIAMAKCRASLRWEGMRNRTLTSYGKTLIFSTGSPTIGQAGKGDPAAKRYEGM